MDTAETKRGLFPALLKYWRGQRGLSQLDLSLAADVSAKHISFIETARSKPSEELVLRLALALDIPLRDQNALLRAAGFEARYDEPSVADALRGPLGQAVDRMLAQHEPFPMVVMSRTYDIVRANRAAQCFLGLCCVQAPTTTNVLHMLFDRNLARTRVSNWDEVARTILTRLHREALHRKQDEEMADLLNALVAYDDVPQSVRQPDMSMPDEPVIALEFDVPVEGELQHFSFITTITAFNAPQNVTLEELMLESYFPNDDATTSACERLLV